METQRNTPKPVALVQSQGAQFEDDFEPEAIMECDVTSLQLASGFWASGNGLGLTMLLLEMHLNCVLGDAWRKVRSNLDLEDLWIFAQLYLVMDEMDVSNLVQMEQIFEDVCVDWNIDPLRSAKLLPLLRAWDLATRWALLRVVSNSLEAARRRAPNRMMLPHRLIRDELKKLIPAVSK